MSELSNIELLSIAREETAAYVDMGHFRKPKEATPYLVDGFQRGYRFCEKQLAAKVALLERAEDLIDHAISGAMSDFDGKDWINDYQALSGKSGLIFGSSMVDKFTESGNIANGPCCAILRRAFLSALGIIKSVRFRR